MRTTTKIIFLATMALSQLATFAFTPVYRECGILAGLGFGLFFWLVNPFFGAAITVFSGLVAKPEEEGR